jgi:hypothetical protein
MPTSALVQRLAAVQRRMARAHIALQSFLQCHRTLVIDSHRNERADIFPSSNAR